MISYAIYTLLDWPGMRTAIVTCFFVALSSLGETVHKLVLRLSGAIIGGLIAGLCIVFVLPHLTDIGQLCLLIAAVSVGAAWVATSSELLSYAGMQIAFAFFLGILQGYAPATDLTVLRDRVAGILLGNIVITIVFSSFWPQSARAGVRAAVADALRAMGEVLRRPRNAERGSPAHRPSIGAGRSLAHLEPLRAANAAEPRAGERECSPGRVYRTPRGRGIRRHHGCDFLPYRPEIHRPVGRVGATAADHLSQEADRCLQVPGPPLPRGQLRWNPTHALADTPSNNSSRRFSMLLRQRIERSTVGLAFMPAC